MKNHLARRGGIWWARLTVPHRLRTAVGKREFCQSTKTHELHIAKMVAAVLVAGWRRQLLALEFPAMSIDLEKMAASSSVIATGHFLSLADASFHTGIGISIAFRRARATHSPASGLGHEPLPSSAKSCCKR